MRYLQGAVLGLLVFLAACGQVVQPEAGSGDVIVITEGAAAPTASVDPLSNFSTSAGATTITYASDTTGLSLGCTTSPSTFATVRFTVIGNQEREGASFDVYQTYTHNGTIWEGSNPKTHTITLGNTIRTYDTTVTLVPSSATPAVGTVGITPVNLQQGSGTRATLSASPLPSATMSYTYTACPNTPANTPPTLTVSDTPAEAAGQTTNAAFKIEVGDAEDTAVDVVCYLGSSNTAFLSTRVALDPADKKAEVSGSVDLDLPLQAYSVTCTVTDSGNESTSDTFEITLVDTTAPVLIGEPTTPLIASSINGASLHMGTLTASDAVDNALELDISITCTPLALSIGANTVSCTATDSSGNESEPQVFTVNVTFSNIAGGFLSPFRNNTIIAKAGSTIPFKVPAPSYAGGLASDLASGLSFTLVKGSSNPIAVTGETFQDYAAGSTAWRLESDGTSYYYIYNLKSEKSWAGTYEATVSYKGIVLATGTVTFNK